MNYLHVRCQSGERLSPTSPNTQEKSIARSLPQNPADSADVLNRIHEKHKLQFWGVALIVLLQVVLNHKLQLWVEMLSCGYQIKAIVCVGGLLSASIARTRGGQSLVLNSVWEQLSSMLLKGTATGWAEFS